MNLSSVLWAVACLGAGVLIITAVCAAERKRRLAAFVRARHPVPIEEQHQRHFTAYHPGQVAEVLSDLGRIYKVDPALLQAEDPFDGPLRHLSLSIPDISYEMVCSLYRRKRQDAGKGVGPLPLTVGQFVQGVLSPSHEQATAPESNEA